MFAMFQVQGQARILDSETLLADSLPKKNFEVYLFSEHRLLESSFELRFPIITSLNKNCGVRNIVLETGQAEAWLCNRFLSTGDTAMLVKTNGYKYSGVKEFWDQLYEYQKDLPAERKMKITGIGFERPGPFGTLLSEFFTSGIAEPEISLALFELINFTGNGYPEKPDKSFYRMLTRFNLLLQKRRADFMKYLSDEQYIFLVISTHNAVNNPANHGQRNTLMFDNLIIHEELLPGKIYFQAGIDYVRKVPGTLGYLLAMDENSPYKNNTLTVDQYYINCSILNKPVKVNYPGRYHRLIDQESIREFDDDYYWMNTGGLPQCDYLIIVKNRKELN
jgi:hypothetical protein